MAKGKHILKEGERFEHYQIVKKLGEGGMGAVYQVYHPALDATFALKILFPDVAERDPEFIDRFVREARLSSRLRHPNLISVHDAGRDIQRGMYYLVMDFVGGGSVRDRLRRQGRMGMDDTCAVILQMLSALTEARKNNMVHRDIKPDNIMFTEAGTAKLADLGIAKSTSECDATLTMESTVFGTPAYMSPEQAHDAKDVDCRADIYSLGIVFYEMLVGRCPYRGSAMALVAQILGVDEVPDVRKDNPEVPAEIARIIAKMCAKKREERYQTPEEVIKDMGKLLGGGITVDTYFAHIAQKENSKTTGTKGASTVISARETWENNWIRARRRKRIGLIAAGVFLLAGIIYGIIAINTHIKNKRAEEENLKIQEAREDAEATAGAEAKRLAREKAELEAKIKAEAERLAEEKAAAEAKAKAEVKRLAQEKTAAEEKIKAEAKRLAREKAELEAKIKAEAERLAEEKAEAEVNRRLAREKAELEAKIKEAVEAQKKAATENEISIGQQMIERDKKMGVKFRKSAGELILDEYPSTLSLKNYKIPLGVTVIGGEAFRRCNILQNIMIPDSVTSIGNGAFSYCDSLRAISIPDSVISIGQWAFSGCGLLQTVTVPNSVMAIEAYTFNDCRFLQSITIPASVMSIEKGAFSDCRSLKSITIPSSVMSIGGRAFYNCSSLRNVIIRNKNIQIGTDAFAGTPFGKRKKIGTK